MLAGGRTARVQWAERALHPRSRASASARQAGPARPCEPGRRDGGYAVALTALVLIPLMAMAGLAIDLGAWQARAAAVQRAADAAALAGVVFLPQGTTAATARARAVAAQNGFEHGVDGVTVEVAEAGVRRLKVTVVDSDVAQYFTSLFGASPGIGRRATAEYILPVPMGSPRNFLGTGRQLSGANRENFWLSVSGHCARREHGDRLTPRAAGEGGRSFAGCVPGIPSNPSGAVLANPEHTPEGYFYAVEFVRPGGTHEVQVFDAPHCQGAGTGADDSGAHSSSARRYEFIMRGPSVDPSTAPVLGSRVLTPADCPAMRAAWRTLFTIANPVADRYFLQIRPLVPATTTGAHAQEGQNQFGLRVASNGAFTPCSTDPTIPGHRAACQVNVFGLTHLGVYAQFSGAHPTFYLARVGPEHSGKTMDIELFDAAEGATRLEILDPNGNPFPFTWEIACYDGSYRSEAGDCTTGENPPTAPGYGPVANVTSINVAGTVGHAHRPWGARNSQSGRYSDRIIRARVQLPDDYGQRVADPAVYNGRTWWMIRYTVCTGAGCSVGDRTTWSVNIHGDPVRLVPNA